MAALALFDALQDFGTRPQPAQSPPPPVAIHLEVERQPEPDIEAIVRQAVEKAEAVLEERLMRAHEAALEAERHGHAEEIEAMLQHFGEQAGQTIAARIGEMEARIGELSSAATARILGSILSDELSKRSIGALVQSIRDAVSDRETVRIKVRGPQSLFETLRLGLGDVAGSVDYVEAPGFDLIVAIDENLFETRLSEWATSLSDIL